MAFQGALQELPLPDILQLVAVSGKTGAFTIRHRRGSGRIFLRDGRIVHATVGDLQGEEAVYELAIWPEGQFVFNPRQEIDVTTIQKSNTNLLMEAARRIDEWKVLSQRIPATSMVPEFVDDTSHPSVSFTREEWAVVRKIDERRSVEQIAGALGASPFEVGKILYGLLSEGLVRLAPGASELSTDRLRQLGPERLAELAHRIHLNALELLRGSDAERLADEPFEADRLKLLEGAGIEPLLEIVRRDERTISSALGPHRARTFLETVTQLVAEL